MSAIESIKTITSYIELAPIVEAMRANNDRRPKNSLPIDTHGTVQSNAKPLPEVTLYNAHGILTKTKPNTLLGIA